MYYKIIIEHIDKGYVLDVEYSPADKYFALRDKVFLTSVNEVKKRIDGVVECLEHPIIAVPVPEKDEWS